jgi:hypothetical protein
MIFLRFLMSFLSCNRNPRESYYHQVPVFGDRTSGITNRSLGENLNHKQAPRRHGRWWRSKSGELVAGMDRGSGGEWQGAHHGSIWDGPKVGRRTAIWWISGGRQPRYGSVLASFVVVATGQVLGRWTRWSRSWASCEVGHWDGPKAEQRLWQPEAPGGALLHAN